MENKISDYKRELNFSTSKNRDLLVVIITSFILLFTLIYLDAFDMLISFTREHENWELDELIMFVIVSSFTALWYSFRRYKEMTELQCKFKNLSNELEQKLREEVERSNKLLQNKNTELEQEIEKTVKEIRRQDNIISQQSKMAAMGEMINNIAHQWKQPLSIITTAASTLSVKQDMNIIKPEDVITSCDNIINNSKYLADTIDDFRNFLKKDKKKQIFGTQNLFENTLKLISSNFVNKNIEIIREIEDIEINGYASELIQVLINILNNAKDELEKTENQRYIFANLYSENNFLNIVIKDSAGGIPDHLFPHIFEAYFTSKKEFQGTGIGLFMSKKIIEESFNGTLEVRNIEYSYEDNHYKGAEFTIQFPIKRP